MQFADRSRVPRFAAALTLTLVVGTACGGGGDADGGEPKAATGRFGQVHQGVCAAAQFSADGDRQRAEDAFDDVHFGIHALVQAVEQQDRAAAARLLEATERVESEGSTQTLEALVEQIADGVKRTGGTAPATCP